MKPSLTRLSISLVSLLGLLGLIGSATYLVYAGPSSPIPEEELAPMACAISNPEVYYLSHFQTSVAKRMDVKDFDKIEVDLNADKEPELLLKLKSLCEKPDSKLCMTMVLQKIDALCYRVIGEFQGVATVTTESNRGYLVLTLANGTKAAFDPIVTEYRALAPKK